MSEGTHVQGNRNLARTVGAIILLVIVLAGGLYLGRHIGGRGGAAAPPETAASATSQVAAAGAPTPYLGTSPAPTVQGATAVAPLLQAQGPVPPVSPTTVPIVDGEPRLWVDEVSAANNYTYQLGEIPANAPASHTFTVSNIGTALLVLNGVSASCGCTTAELGKETLQPGESTTVRVTYDPRANGDKGISVEKSVFIRSDDPLAPLAEFKIAAQVANQ